MMDMILTEMVILTNTLNTEIVNTFGEMLMEMVVKNVKFVDFLETKLRNKPNKKIKHYETTTITFNNDINAAWFCPSGI